MELENSIFFAAVEERLREGERVTIAMPNCPQAIYMLYAVNLIGAVAYATHKRNIIKIAGVAVKNLVSLALKEHKPLRNRRKGRM